MTQETRLKSRTAAISVLSNTVLTLLKLIAGLLTGSVAILSEAIHSGMDLLAAIMAFVAVRASGKPADNDHPFGHGKFENLAGTLEAFLIFVAAGLIFYEAVAKLIHPEPVDNGLLWGVAVMGLSTIANILVSNRLFKVGKQTDSVALIADGWHLRTDVYTSAGVFAGLLIMVAGEKLLPGRHFHWIDPVAAIFVTMLIVKAAWALAIQSGKDLLDTSLPLAEEELIRRHILEMAPEVKGFHHLRTRKSGSSRYVDVHMVVESTMSVARSHELTDRLIGSIREHFPDTTLNIHVEPCDGVCATACSAGCLVQEKKFLRNRGV
ncbi:MAG: hypothetical protein A2293_07965 [Elusimicrobia bacterium RIFOXYB2_FULL_49_7]|nr:MAG: hypothetical protein A2293_07965 [Elusimicrobia bacterium RIFOXYB2_FULL_49_7]